MCHLIIYNLQWSYGITCWEVFSLGRVPYPGVGNLNVIITLKAGKRLGKPTLCPDKLWVVSCLCIFNFNCYNFLNTLFWSIKSVQCIILSTQKQLLISCKQWCGIGLGEKVVKSNAVAKKCFDCWSVAKSLRCLASFTASLWISMKFIGNATGLPSQPFLGCHLEFPTQGLFSLGCTLF